MQIFWGYELKWLKKRLVQKINQPPLYLFHPITIGIPRQYGCAINRRVVRDLYTDAIEDIILLDLTP